MTLTWLQALDEDALRRLLERRPDAVRGVPPQDLSDLAERLALPQSVALALQQLPLPALHVVEAAQALGGETVDRLDLADFLAGDGPEHLAAVDEVLAQLTEVGVVIPVEGGGFLLPAAFDSLFSAPLRLGEPLRLLLRSATVDAIRRQARAFGLPRVQQNKAATTAMLVAAFRDHDRLSRRVASAPPDVLDGLVEALDRDDNYYRYDYDRHQRAIEWAQSAGLVVDIGYRTVQIPAEVARVLRGPDYRAPFSPESPALQAVSLSTERVVTEAAAAAAGFAARALTVLDRVAQGGVPTVAAGGVGTRELTKLAKAIGVGEVETRLVLELAVSAGLLATADRQLAPTDELRDFRDAAPAERFATLLETWSQFPGTPTQARDEDDKAVPVGMSRMPCGGCLAARAALLDVLVGVDGAVDPGSAARAALWRRPLVHAVGDPPLTAVWHEAELLGVIALGSLTPLGEALGNPAELRAVAAGLLPPTIDQVTFGADLTAYVAGAPSSRVSALLDSAADRESGGGAVTWRFGPGSVRRALDGGATGDGLTAALASVSRRELPSALTVLIADVARKHGNLRLTSAVCCVRSDDVALLAEVVRDRRLSPLGLRSLTPTVLTGDQPLSETLAALRKAGYFPLSDEPEPELRTVMTVRRRQPAPVAEQAVDLDAVVRQLLRAPTKARATTSLTQRLLSAETRSLSAAEVRQLAHAIDHGQSIGIGYEAVSGAVTERVVSEMQLMGTALVGWCELRQDERSFSVRRILSVRAV